MCQKCINEDDYAPHLMNYGYKPLPSFYTITSSEEGKVCWHKYRAYKTDIYNQDIVNILDGYLPMGVELETQLVNDCGCDDCSEEDDDYMCNDERDYVVQNVVTDIHNQDTLHNKSFDMYDQLVYAKYDGSLYRGIEFVTQPMTMKAHKELDWVSQLHHRSLYSYSTDRTGVHIHIPKTMFDTKPLFIFNGIHDNFINDKLYKPLLQFIAGRGNVSYAKWESPYHFGLDKEYSPSVNVARTKTSSNERSTMLNFQNRATIELRYFKGNIRPATLYSYLEFVQSMYDFSNVIAKTASPIYLQRIKTDYVSNWLAFLFINREYYPLLTERLETSYKPDIQSLVVLNNLEDMSMTIGRRI